MELLFIPCFRLEFPWEPQHREAHPYMSLGLADLVPGDEGFPQQDHQPLSQDQPCIHAQGRCSASSWESGEKCKEHHKEHGNNLFLQTTIGMGSPSSLPMQSHSTNCLRFGLPSPPDLGAP